MQYLLTGGAPEAGIESRRLRRVLRRCTAFSPWARYQRITAVRRALLANTPKCIRRKAAVIAVAMLVIGICVGRFVLPAVENRIAERRAEVSGARDEYERAAEYGFIPPELANADPDKTVIHWGEYCAMLGRMIEAYDEGLMPEWERMTANAPDTPMKRDGGMVSLLFAAELMGLDSFNAPEPEGFLAYAPEVWQNVTMDYPVFDFMQPKKITEGCFDNNYVGPSYDFCLRRLSQVSGKSLLEFDWRNDLRLSAPYTLREAVQAVLRLYESAN